MRRWVSWIALAAAALQGCSKLTGTPSSSGPAPGAAATRPEPIAKLEEPFRGRWYVLDRNMSCLQDRTVTFADGKATYHRQVSLGGKDTYDYRVVSR